MREIAVKFVCNNCGAHFYVNADKASEVHRCPFCNDTSLSHFGLDFCVKEIEDYDEDCRWEEYAKED